MAFAMALSPAPIATFPVPRRLKPDVRISRIRLSDKDSCVRPRKVTGAHLQPG